MDSTPIKVCDNHRISSNRVFSEYAKKRKEFHGLVLWIQAAPHY
ncbi:MAG: transposase [Oscillospiraceae bacterium]|nr:transposase [Oscillospiraceae bacterium]